MKINDIINEDASIGGTMAGNVASIPGQIGGVVRRNRAHTEYANSKKPGKTKFKQVKEN